KPTLIAITTEESFPQPPPFPEVEVTSGSENANLQTTINPYPTTQSSVVESTSAFSEAVSPSNEPSSPMSFPSSHPLPTVVTNPDPYPSLIPTDPSVSIPGREFTMTNQGYTIEVIKFTGDFRKTTVPGFTFPDFLPEATPSGNPLEVHPENTAESPSDITGDPMLESIPNIEQTMPTVSINSPFGRSSPSVAVEKGNEDILINLITIATPPTTSALPVATGMS
ncbi:hypothetical protein FO519_010620, partial [Halicephalobus sp. NKZ332]